MTLEEMLASIEASMKKLTEREAAGEDVAGEKQKLAEQKAALTDKNGTERKGEDELSRLRREAREREEREMAESIIGKAVHAVADEEKARAERIRGFVEQALTKRLEGGGMDDTVRRVLSETRTPSRFAGEGADESAVKELAARGGAVPNRSMEVRHVGAELEAKQIIESKNLVKFMSMIARKSRGHYLSDGETHLLQEMGRKALSEGTDAAGGFLVPQEWMPDILGILRAQAVVRRAGPRFVPFNKQMNQTAVSTGATAYYTAENAAITPSEQAFSEAAILTPKNLTGLVPVSNYLLSDAQGADTIVRDDLVEVLALKEDLSFIQGDGSGGSPIGLKNLASISTDPVDPGTNGSQFTLPQFRRIKQFTRTLNVRNGRWGFFCNPQLISYMETLTDSLGRFLADANILSYDENGGAGTFDGVPFWTTTQIPVNLTTGSSSNTTYLVMVNLNELIVGINQEMVIDVSSEASYTPDGGTSWISAFQNNQTLFRSVLRHDITHRRPNQVLLQTGVIIP